MREGNQARFRQSIPYTQDHHFRGLNQSNGSLAGLEMHLAGRCCGDDRSDLLLSDGDFHFRHEAADADLINAADELVASADAAYNLLAFLLGSAARAEKQTI